MPFHVVFEVGGVRAAVPAADVLEVVAVRDAVPVPGAPPFVAGLLGHRGAVVPLVDGAERVTGVPAPAGRATLALLVGTSLGTIGITADRVIDLEDADVTRGRRIDVELLVRECRQRLAPYCSVRPEEPA